MKKIIFYSLFLLLSISACIQNSSNQILIKSSVSGTLITNIDSGFSGVALIANSNGIVFHKAYNGKGDNVDTGTAFYIASNGKSFVATAIMQLQEKGKLSVNDSISNYFKEVPADKKNITIHNLLTHTSGFDYCECTDGEMNKEKIIKSILDTKLKNPVGEKWAYENENYYLLEFIVEQVSGMSFKDYIKENILKPAGMINTGFWGYEKEIPVTIAPLNVSLKTMPLYQKIFKNGLPKPTLFSGIFSTSSDLYKWTVALQERKLLSESSLTASFQSYEKALIRNTNDTAIYYGYGWIPTTTKSKRLNVFHAGREDWMMNNRIYMLDNGITIIVWAMEKKGPDSDAMATVLTKELVKKFQKLQ